MHNNCNALYSFREVLLHACRKKGFSTTGPVTLRSRFTRLCVCNLCTRSATHCADELRHCRSVGKYYSNRRPPRGDDIMFSFGATTEGHIEVKCVRIPLTESSHVCESQRSRLPFPYHCHSGRTRMNWRRSRGEKKKTII